MEKFKGGVYAYANGNKFSIIEDSLSMRPASYVGDDGLIGTDGEFCSSVKPVSAKVSFDILLCNLETKKDIRDLLIRSAERVNLEIVTQGVTFTFDNASRTSEVELPNDARTATGFTFTCSHSDYSEQFKNKK